MPNIDGGGEGRGMERQGECGGNEGEEIEEL